MTDLKLPTIPRVNLERCGIVSTRPALGRANWPFQVSYDQVVATFREAFALGIRPNIEPTSISHSAAQNAEGIRRLSG